ncbi:MAG: hypothetical protein AABM33_00680 [Pseudomonadota bacterium]
MTGSVDSGSVRFFDAQFRRQAAAARGAHVLALDGSPAAIESLKSRARALEAVRPAGTLIVNLLIEGTTFMGMFDEKAGYCLFGEEELPRTLTGWQMLEDRVEQFPAPEGIKRFRTTIARRPAALAVP